MGNCAGKLQKNKVPKEQRTAEHPPAAQTAAKTAPAQAPTSVVSTTATAPKSAATATTTTTTPTTTTTAPTTGPSTSSGTVTKSVNVHHELHKYIIGSKGATVKEIKESSGVTSVDCVEGSDTVNVTGSNDACDRAIVMINKIASEHKTSEQRDKEYKEMRDGHEAESQRTDAMYKKYQSEIDALADKRTKLHEEADKAYEAGDKQRAHELREQAKQQTQLMEEANKKASREIFNDKNKGLDQFTVDLHGLKTKDALELMDERINKLKADKSNSGKEFTIITGAGNHSDEQGAKIKPLIHKTFNERGIKFTEVNNGSIQIHL